MVVTKPVGPDDQEFLYQVYVSTRQAEVAAWGWAPAQQEAFFRMQFQAQTRSWQATYPGADSRVILHNGEPAGRLIINRSPSNIAVVDIAVLPQFRGAGIGTQMIRELQAEASQADLPLCLRVAIDNSQAMRFYHRLGFVPVASNQVYYSLEWRATP